MFKKITKILMSVFALLLVIILFTYSTKVGSTAESFGSVLIFLTGIFALVMSIFVTNDLKLLNKSLLSRITSVALVNLIWYFMIILFYGLSGIGTGDKGLLFPIIYSLLFIVLVISLIIDIFLVVKNKKQTKKGRINAALLLVLMVVLFILFYTSLVSGLASLTQSTPICSLNLEIRGNSFIFRKGSVDNCIYPIARKTNNPDYCELIEDKHVEIIGNSRKNHCLLNVARDRGDTTICYKITNDDDAKGRCIEYIAVIKKDLSICEEEGVTSKDWCYYNMARGKRGFGDPEICSHIQENSLRYHCFSTIALDKKDPTICENIPSDEVLIEQGIDPLQYSIEKCKKDALKGSFN